MEQLDGTVLATALPAMARSFNADPLHMNIALTSYLLTLAMFIPASGRIADRFGSTIDLPHGDRAVHPRLDPVRAGANAMGAGRRADAARRRRRDDVAGRAAGDAAGGVEGRTGALDGMADGAGDHRADRRAAGGRLHRDLSVLALDLLHQRADRPGRHRPGHDLHRRDEGAGTNQIRPARTGAVRHRAGLPDVRDRGRQPRRRLHRDRRGAAGRRVGFGRALLVPRPPDATADAGLPAAAGDDVPDVAAVRIAVAHRRRRHAVPAADDVSARFWLFGGAKRADHLRQFRRVAGDARLCAVVPETAGIPSGADLDRRTRHRPAGAERGVPARAGRCR